MLSSKLPKKYEWFKLNVRTNSSFLTQSSKIQEEIFSHYCFPKYCNFKYFLYVQSFNGIIILRAKDWKQLMEKMIYKLWYNPPSKCSFIKETKECLYLLLENTHQDKKKKRTESIYTMSYLWKGGYRRVKTFMLFYTF